MQDLGCYPRKISIVVHKLFYLKDYKPLLQFYSQHNNYCSLLEVNNYFLPFLSEGHISDLCTSYISFISASSTEAQGVEKRPENQKAERFLAEAHANEQDERQ